MLRYGRQDHSIIDNDHALIKTDLAGWPNFEAADSKTAIVQDEDGGAGAEATLEIGWRDVSHAGIQKTAIVAKKARAASKIITRALFQCVSIGCCSYCICVNSDDFA